MLFKVLLWERLQQTELAGARDGFGAPLDLQFVKDSAVVPFYRMYGQEQPFANLLIRKPLRNEPEYFQFALA